MGGTMSRWSLLPSRGVAASLLVLAIALPAVGQERGDWRRPAGTGWPVNGGDWGNTRYTSLTQITPANLNQLAGAWTKNFPGEASRAVPVVQDGVMYLTTTNKA